jgi:hypothetical protein
MTTDVDTRGAPADATVLSLVRPVPHDFAYRICAVCHFPIPPQHLVDDDYRPRHDTCDPGRPPTASPAWKVA